MPKILGREDILKALDCPIDSILVPEWGGIVHFRAMSGEERDRFDAEVLAARETGRSLPARAELASRVLCDESGARLFTQDDVAALGRKSGVALDRVVARAMKAGLMGDAGVEVATGN